LGGEKYGPLWKDPESGYCGGGHLKTGVRRTEREKDSNVSSVRVAQKTERLK